MGDEFDAYQVRFDATGFWLCDLFGGLIFRGGFSGVYSDVDADDPFIKDESEFTVGPQFGVSKEFYEDLRASIGWEHNDANTIGISASYSF